MSTASFDSGRERRYVKSEYHPGPFYVDHLYEVEVHDVERVGPAISAMRAAGASCIAGVRFWLTDEEQHRSRAARQAAARARSCAQEMADAAGVALGDLVRLGTPEALVATLGAGSGADGSMRRALLDPGLQANDHDITEHESAILPEPITIEVVVHGAWEAERCSSPQSA